MIKAKRLTKKEQSTAQYVLILLDRVEREIAEFKEILKYGKK